MTGPTINIGALNYYLIVKDQKTDFFLANKLLAFLACISSADSILT